MCSLNLRTVIYMLTALERTIIPTHHNLAVETYRNYSLRHREVRSFAYRDNPSTPVRENIYGACVGSAFWDHKVEDRCDRLLLSSTAAAGWRIPLDLFVSDSSRLTAPSGCIYSGSWVELNVCYVNEGGNWNVSWVRYINWTTLIFADLCQVGSPYIHH